jgi:hypothetical protein
LRAALERSSAAAGSAASTAFAQAARVAATLAEAAFARTRDSTQAAAASVSGSVASAMAEACRSVIRPAARANRVAGSRVSKARASAMASGGGAGGQAGGRPHLGSRGLLGELLAVRGRAGDRRGRAQLERRDRGRQRLARAQEEHAVELVQRRGVDPRQDGNVPGSGPVARISSSGCSQSSPTPSGK